MAANRKLAASLLLRQEELAAEVASSPADDPRRSELVDVESQLQAALAEMAQLRKLAADLPTEEAKALLRAAAEPDPLIRTPEEQALDRTREHLANLEAQLGLSDQLASPPPTRRPTPAEAEAEARRQLEELRARRARKL
jgi:hypothetical protein